MPYFKYIATDQSGEECASTLQADDYMQAYSHVRDQGLDVVKVFETKSPSGDVVDVRVKREKVVVEKKPFVLKRDMSADTMTCVIAGVVAACVLVICFVFGFNKEVLGITAIIGTTIGAWSIPAVLCGYLWKYRGHRFSTGVVLSLIFSPLLSMTVTFIMAVDQHAIDNQKKRVNPAVINTLGGFTLIVYLLVIFYISPVAGFFVIGYCFFLLIVSTLLKVNRYTSPPKTSVTTKKCPYCAEFIQTEAIKCRFCGEQV